MKKKRIMAVLLTLAMAMGLAPATALADEQRYTVEICVGGYASGTSTVPQGTVSCSFHSFTYDTVTLEASCYDAELKRFSAVLGNDVAKGTTVTLSQTPATGYIFDRWKVTKWTDTEKVQLNSDGESFEMPESGVTIEAIYTTTEDQQGGDQGGTSPALTISGNPYVGETLTATLTGATADKVLTYEWYRVYPGITIPDEEIPPAYTATTTRDGSFSTSYRLGSNDVGKNIYVRVIIEGSVTCESGKTDTITKLASTVTTPPAAIEGLVYNGTEQALCTAGTVTGGTINYTLKGPAEAERGWSTEIPTAKNAGSYTVYYRAVGDGDHTNSAEGSFSVSIAEKPLTVKPKSYTIRPGNEIPTPTLEYIGLVDGETINLGDGYTPAFEYYVSGKDTPVKKSDLTLGTYDVTWTNLEASDLITEAANYEITSETGTLTIKKKSSSSTESESTSGGGGSSTTTEEKKEDTAKDETKVETKDEAKEEPKDETKTETTLPFTDVKTNDWFYGDVAYANSNSLMYGTTETTFAPKLSTTRGMITTILHRLEGKPAATKATTFTDVASGMYYENAIAWAAENAVANGYGDGKFGPNDTITREQLAAMLYRYAAFKGIDTTASASLTGFTDGAQASAYAVPALQWAVAEKLVYGDDNGALRPTAQVTRAEAAALLHRFIEKLNK